MTPKEKAQELINKFSSGYPIISKMNTRNMYISEAKQCALIAVDEIIAISSLTKIVYTESTNNSISEYTEHYYWQQVKEEINKL
jgi:hypothetical protein